MVEITEAMRQAGWGNCPYARMREKWEEAGGEWEIIDASGKPSIAPKNWSDQWSKVYASSIPWRPLSPVTWNYDARGWGETLTPVNLSDRL